MSIACPLFIVAAYLCGSDHIRLCFDGAGAQESGPVRSAGSNGEGGRVGDDVSALATERDRGFREAELNRRQL